MYLILILILNTIFFRRTEPDEGAKGIKGIYTNFGIN